MAMQNIPGKYEFLPHTADIKFRAFGVDKAHAFAHAAQALLQVLTDPQALQEVDKQVWTHSAVDDEEQLVVFLEHILFLIDAEQYIPASFVVDFTNGISVTMYGQDIHDVRFDADVKSITHHQLDVRVVDGGWIITCVVDV